MDIVGWIAVIGAPLALALWVLRGSKYNAPEVTDEDRRKANDPTNGLYL